MATRADPVAHACLAPIASKSAETSQPKKRKRIRLIAMKLADSHIDAQEGALLAQDAIAEWLDRYRLELDSETEQVIYEGIMDSLKRADLVELK